MQILLHHLPQSATLHARGHPAQHIQQSAANAVAIAITNCTFPYQFCAALISADLVIRQPDDIRSLHQVASSVLVASSFVPTPKALKIASDCCLAYHGQEEGVRESQGCRVP